MAYDLSNAITENNLISFLFCDLLVWDNWQDWSDCDVTCGGGTRQRTRDCINGSPGDIGCDGEVTETEDCNTDECPGKC